MSIVLLRCVPCAERVVAFNYTLKRRGEDGGCYFPHQIYALEI